MGKYGEMKKAGDWVGRLVKTKIEIQNQVLVLPKGSICKVTYAYRGLDMTGPKCGCCGVGVFFRKVGYHDVTAVEAEGQEFPTPTTDPATLPLDVKRKLIAARDGLVRLAPETAVDEAYRQLYSIADPGFTRTNPWERIEKSIPKEETKDKD